jgi:CheY-like chemotaxis protein/MinD-like ATPase involved in chromosome partitioning or flagellar assembly
VLIVDDAQVMRTIMRKVLERDYEVVGDAGDGMAAVEAVEEHRPDIVMMDVTMPVMDGIQATRIIMERFPETAVVILSGVSNDRSVYAGLSAGARDYLVKPAKQDEILEVLSRLSRQIAERRGATEEEEDGPPGAGVWSFCGALGGGDGRTTLVLSLANELLSMNQRVVVLDADLVFGDAAFYLGIDKGSFELKDIVKPDTSLAAPQLARMVRDHGSGLRLMGRTRNGEPCFEAEPERIVALTRALRDIADYVLVDLPAGVPDSLLPILDESRHVFTVASARPERLRNLRVMVDVLKMCGMTPPRLFPVVTRGEAPLGGDLGIEECFPEDVEAVQAARNEFMPVTRVAPRSAYTQKVRELVARLLKVPSQPKSGILGGLFQRLRG